MPVSGKRTQAGPESLRHHDAVLGTLRQAGFSIELAAHAYSVQDTYIYGFTMQELTVPARSTEEIAVVGGGMLRGMPAGAYAYLAEMIVEQALRSDYSVGIEFTFGLDLMLHGLARLCETA